MTTWMVHIEEGEDEGDPAEFVPQLQAGPDLLANAGDLVSWHQALRQGASPNSGTRPRMVQYVNMFPTHYEEQDEWI